MTLAVPATSGVRHGHRPVKVVDRKRLLLFVGFRRNAGLQFSPLSPFDLAAGLIGTDTSGWYGYVLSRHAMRGFLPLIIALLASTAHAWGPGESLAPIST
jgi:hypothetical protein